MKHHQRQERDNQLGGGGVGNPNRARWGIARHEPTPPSRPRRGATHNSADFGDYSRTRPSARGSGIAEAFLNRERQPQTPPRRARWGNDQVGTNTGILLARSPIGRGAAGLRSFFSVVVFRETKVGQSKRGNAPPNPTAASRRGRGDSFTFNLQTLASYCGRPGPWWFRFHLVARRRGGPYP